MSTIHFYAQGFPHGDAFVVADTSGLAALSEALAFLLATGATSTELQTFTGDGEGYTVHIVVADTEKLAQMQPVYTDEFDKSSRGIHPFDLLQAKSMETKEIAVPPWDDPLS